MATALLLVSALPAAGQSLGAGISFLGDSGGAGVVVDYSKPYKTQSGDKALGWVVDFGLNHKGFGNDFAGVTGGITTFMLQAGVRMTGKANDKVTWHGQGLFGYRRASFSTDAAGLTKEVCDAFNIDCSASASDAGAVLTVGGALQYALNDKSGVRAQLDFPIAIGSDGGSTTRFSIMYVIKR